MVSVSLRKRAQKGKEKKWKTVFEGNDISKVDDFAGAAGPRPNVGYHYLRERDACQQVIREQPSLKFTAETLTSTSPECFVSTSIKKMEDVLRGWRADFPGGP